MPPRTSICTRLGFLVGKLVRLVTRPRLGSISSSSVLPALDETRYTRDLFTFGAVMTLPGRATCKLRTTSSFVTPTRRPEPSSLIQRVSPLRFSGTRSFGPLTGSFTGSPASPSIARTTPEVLSTANTVRPTTDMSTSAFLVATWTRLTIRPRRMRTASPDLLWATQSAPPGSTAGWPSTPSNCKVWVTFRVSGLSSRTRPVPRLTRYRPRPSGPATSSSPLAPGSVVAAQFKLRGSKLMILPSWVRRATTEPLPCTT